MQAMEGLVVAAAAQDQRQPALDDLDFWVYMQPVGLYNVLATRPVRNHAANSAHPGARPGPLPTESIIIVAAKLSYAYPAVCEGSIRKTGFILAAKPFVSICKVSACFPPFLVILGAAGTQQQSQSCSNYFSQGGQSSNF